MPRYASLPLLLIAIPVIILCVLFALSLSILALFLTSQETAYVAGQYPSENRQHIKQGYGKLSKAAVDKIPLVLYIPAPEDPGSTPAATSSYPRHPTLPATSKLLGQFFHFLVRGNTRKPGSKEKGKARDNSGSGDRWEDDWEKGEYPFVRLEDNHATCAICLADFLEPERTGSIFGRMMMRIPGRGLLRARPAAPKRVPRDRRELRLEDAGEGPQPLRLLPCGHALHKTCIDPWLICVSARCPICNRAVGTGELENNEPTMWETWV